VGQEESLRHPSVPALAAGMGAAGPPGCTSAVPSNCLLRPPVKGSGSGDGTTPPPELVDASGGSGWPSLVSLLRCLSGDRTHAPSMRSIRELAAAGYVTSYHLQHVAPRGATCCTWPRRTPKPSIDVRRASCRVF
jgi:hypothetical protein